MSHKTVSLAGIVANTFALLLLPGNKTKLWHLDAFNI